MKLLKPHWVTHGSNPIYSISIHPDGTRIATGGQGNDSGIVVIWNSEPIRSETAENNTKVPKMLCELTNHLGCVNCVKWSNDGKWLASSGDDAVIMLWNLRYKGLSAPAFGSKNPTHEQWGCGFMLRGHSGDVLDISWSHDNRYLASASVDNTIIVWNAMKLPEQITSLSSHSGLVKGLTWDPVGKYLASQSDDKSVRVWRTSDWKEEAKVTQPFEDCSGTTHVLRLSWSPDGRFIVSAHSLNNDGPTAHIIERNSWKTGMDFVGHRKSIEVVSFNPQLFSKGASSNHGCVAIGSRDRSVSVWLTSLKRPLVVIHDLFNNSVLDLAWSKDGYTLMACSLDGTCAYMSFTKEELGLELDKDAINDLFLDLYGTKRFTHGKSMDEPLDLLVEDPAMLINKHDNKVSNEVTTPTVTPSKDGSVVSMQKQIETRTKDGRRRITPITLTSEPSYGSIQTAAFASPQTTSQTTSKTTPKESSTPQKNQSLLSAAMDKTERTVKSPSQAQPISFAPLSPDLTEKEPKTQPTLSAAKALITGVKRSNQEPLLAPDVVKPKRVKKVKPSDSTTSTTTTTTKQSFKSASSVTPCLPSPSIEACYSVNVTLDNIPSIVEVSNGSSSGGCTVSCVQGDTTVWSALLSSSATLLSSSHYITCVAMEDRSVIFLSTATGRQMFPTILPSSAPYSIVISSHFVGIATVNATFSVYDTSKFSSVLCNISFSHLFNDAGDLKRISLTDNGQPIVITEKQVYCYNTNMQVWINVVSEAECSIVRSSKFALSSTVTELTPLRSLQHSVGFSSGFAAGSSSMPSRNATLMYLENQIGRSLCLRSVMEYRHWVKCYVRFLVSESMEERLREFMLSLSSETVPSNYSSSGFVQECLSIVTSNTKLQRLYCELRDNIGTCIL